MFRDRQDVAEAKKLCDFLTEQLSDEIPRIRLNCYHAIGHGAIVEPRDSVKWGNPHALLAPALEICDAVSSNPQEVRECLQGAFNVVADWTWRGEYGLVPPKKENPLGFCEAGFSREHALACYYEMAMYLNTLFDDDLLQIAKVLEEVPDDEVDETIIDVVAAGLMVRGSTKEDYTEYIFACRNLPEHVRLRCIIGISGGFMAHGEPGREYVKAIKFCSLSELFEQERAVCFQNIIRTFKGSYPRHTVEQICAAIDAKYLVYCSYDYSQSL